MLEELRWPFFIVAVVLIAAVVLTEFGSQIFVSGGRIGLGIPYSALVDGLLFYMIILMVLALIMPGRLHGALQGIVTLIVSLLTALASFVMIFAALLAVTEMVALLLAVPFGTFAYFALFSKFDRATASVELGMIMTFKLLFAVCLVLAQQRFLNMKLLVFTVLLSLLVTVIVSFLQGLVPSFLVSITDGVAAIILAVLGLVWAIVLLLRSIPAVVKAIV
jgi:hypothetical protein